MARRKTVEFFHPTIYIRKSPTPVIFIDTFMWRNLLKSGDRFLMAVKRSCQNREIKVAISSGILGELSQRNMLTQIQEICGDALISIPMGRIAANQIIQSMVCYFEKRQEVTLSWKLAISNVPALSHPQTDLKQIIETVKKELNAAFRNSPKKEGNIRDLVEIERNIWRKSLFVYGDILTEAQGEKIFKIGPPLPNYKKFYLTDYFTDLPFIVLSSYLFAYVLNERNIKTQDIVDIYCLSELAPYCSLFILDGDQHNRIKRMQNDYPILFKRLDKLCCISSYLASSQMPPPEALNSFFKNLPGQVGDFF